MVLKKLLLLACVFISLQVLAQPAAKKYTFREIGWTIMLPADFIAFPSADSSIHIDPGGTGQPLVSKRLIMAMNNTNLFTVLLSSCNLQSADKDYGFNAANRKSYQSSAQAQGSGQGFQIDSATTTTTIDGVPFKTFRMTTRKNNLINNSLLTMATCYKGFYISITLTYYSKKAEQELESMLDQSKFSK